jgi:hypothetical protein
MRFAHAALTAVAHGGDPQDRAASLATTGRQSLQRGEPPVHAALPWEPRQRSGSPF